MNVTTDVAKKRFETCKKCEYTRKQGSGCILRMKCCFGKWRTRLDSKCPSGKW